MKKSVCFLVFICGVFIIQAQTNVRISGQDTSYSGVNIEFLKYSDQITNTEVVLNKCTVADDGMINIQFSVGKTTFVFAYIGIYKVHLYVSPGNSYNIILPPRQDKEPQDFLNPYFSPVIVHLATENFHEDELNVQIRMFNDAFLPYYNKHIMAVREKDDFEQLDKDIARMEKSFASSKNVFFTNYRKYRYGLLRHLAYQQKSKSISDEYFKDQPILLNNPAYMELFNRVYDNYFQHFSRTEQGKDLGSIISSQKLIELRNLLAHDEVLGKEELLDMVILKGIYDEFYDDNYPRSALLEILNTLISENRNPELTEVAVSIREKTTRLLSGFEPPEFELYNGDSNLVSLNDFRGKYVYLNFCSCFSYTCLNEFKFLSTLYEKHKDRLEIVTILVDNDEDVINSFLERSNYKWMFLHYGHQSSVIRDYDIRAFPIYYLIDPEGKLALSPAPSPAEDFEARFFSLLRARGEL
ncbi:MAG: TlpA family protein disulfide reductase [Bacteroidales bacterium]|nr:TlpA family protein disulfide reductase [Bacteroidales bacterium]